MSQLAGRLEFAPMLSIIIPVYNEAESLDALFAEIDEVARAN